jgi:hypothetical protein
MGGCGKKFPREILVKSFQNNDLNENSHASLRFYEVYSAKLQTVQ